eukprot:s78_g6.t1
MCLAMLCRLAAQPMVYHRLAPRTANNPGDAAKHHVPQERPAPDVRRDAVRDARPPPPSVPPPHPVAPSAPWARRTAASPPAQAQHVQHAQHTGAPVFHRAPVGQMAPLRDVPPSITSRSGEVRRDDGYKEMGDSFGWNSTDDVALRRLKVFVGVLMDFEGILKDLMQSSHFPQPQPKQPQAPQPPIKLESLKMPKEAQEEEDVSEVASEGDEPPPEHAVLDLMVPRTALVINISHVLKRLNGCCSLNQLTKQIRSFKEKTGMSLEAFLRANPMTFKLEGRIVYLVDRDGEKWTPPQKQENPVGINPEGFQLEERGNSDSEEAAKSGTLTVARGRESPRANREAMPVASLAVTKETPEVAKTTASQKAPEGNPMANGGREILARSQMAGMIGRMIGRMTGKMNGRTIGRQTTGKDRGRTLSFWSV